MQHVTTTAYHPQSNGMVERLHRQVKASLRARSEGQDWLEHLPWAMLGLRAQPKDEANVSPAEAALGTKLQIPGQPLPVEGAYVPPAERPVIPNTTRSRPVEGQVVEEKLCGPEEMVYVRDGQPCGPLAPTYVGPYRVLERKGKVLKLQFRDREDWVAVERTKKHAGAEPVEPAQPPRRGRPPGKKKL
jgi:hypothetical protein